MLSGAETAVPDPLPSELMSSREVKDVMDLHMTDLRPKGPIHLISFEDSMLHHGRSADPPSTFLSNSNYRLLGETLPLKKLAASADRVLQFPTAPYVVTSGHANVLANYFS